MQKKVFTTALLDWFQREKRPLPWRREYQPYHVWISEVMLQQTQMDRVVPFFERWIAQFPTIHSVAKAQEDDLYKAWEGLGYYSRARNIASCARQLMEYGGVFPEEYKLLLTLPGIGPYTAGAIMSIAFNKPYPVVDANVKRLFARLYDIEEPLTSTAFHNHCDGLARELLFKENPRDFNQALMELGALICLAQIPRCTLCPVHQFCRSLKNNTTHLRPFKKTRQQRIPVSVVAGVIYHGDRIYIQKRLAKSRWAHLWEFPGGHVEKDELPEEALIREITEETGFSVGSIHKLTTLEHSFTKYRYILHAYSCTLAQTNHTPTLTAAQEYRWLPLAELSSFAYSSGHRKLLQFLLKNNLQIPPCGTLQKK